VTTTSPENRACIRRLHLSLRDGVRRVSVSIGIRPFWTTRLDAAGPPLLRNFSRPELRNRSSTNHRLAHRKKWLNSGRSCRAAYHGHLVAHPLGLQNLADDIFVHPGLEPVPQAVRRGHQRWITTSSRRLRGPSNSRRLVSRLETRAWDLLENFSTYQATYLL
jgi:hypothetical protein